MSFESKNSAYSGKVLKWFPDRNYGFIQSGEKTYFFHKSQIVTVPDVPQFYQELSKDDVVTFDIGSHKGKTVAINVKIAGDKLVEIQQIQKKYAEDKRAQEERKAEFQRIIQVSKTRNIEL